MPKLYITEYVCRGTDTKGVNQFVEQPPVATQVLDTAGTTLSAVFNSTTSILRLCADGPVAYLVGANPTATVNDTRLPGNWVEYIDLPREVSQRISIAASR